MVDAWPPEPLQANGTDDTGEACRHWEQLHDDECYRDVHGVPTWGAAGDRWCLVLLAVVAGGIIALLALAVWLVAHFLF
jgi:hypothetical protein